jgi:CRISPR system Cascade subunit CasD|nr:type I-E CRISPR-associated protein Cas5/CasD [uncultured Rhodopila sp.]
MPGTEFLLLRLEAPLMAFGGPMVDHIGQTRSFPGQAQITGLLGNALGYRHRDTDALDTLQRRLLFAAALVRPGEPLRDYHTVDLSRKHLTGTGWTTRDMAETRGGASGESTHIRHRWYLADALVLVALTLVPGDVAPSLDDLATVLDCPARPLFIGRKPCLPTAPIRLGKVRVADAKAALHEAQLLLAQTGPVGQAGERGKDTCIRVEADARLASDTTPNDEEADRVVDRRDWRNQMHTGQRAVRRFSMQRVAELAR